MLIVRHCPYGYQECRLPSHLRCRAFPGGAFGVPHLEVERSAVECPERGRTLTRCQYGHPLPLDDDDEELE